MNRLNPTVLRCLAADQVTDADLLTRFATSQDAAAFELLVWRHAGMVLRVCRGVLRDYHAAEDAAQATFLTLARRAAAVGHRGTVAGWLYRVARRTATRAALRLSRTPTGSPDELDRLPAPASSDERDPAITQLLHDELARLPDRYRVALLLCFFEGRTQAAAAAELGVPVGTVATWVARAKDCLRRRLAGRGVQQSAGVLAAALIGESAAALPLAFVADTARAATAFAEGNHDLNGVSNSVLALAREGNRMTRMTQLLWIVGVMLAGGVALGSVWAASEPLPPNPPPGEAAAGQAAQPPAAKLPDTFDPTKSALWKAELGTRTHSRPVVADGRVFIGTNNGHPRNKRDMKLNPDGTVEPIDRGVLMCFDRTSGKFLWQAVHDKLPSGQLNDWPEEGIWSTPAVEGGRVYYVSNRGELVCADVSGFADGNQGFQGEQYQTPTDADILWLLDMPKELGVFVHRRSVSSPLIVGDAVFVVTGNGVDEDQIIPSPDAPSFIAVDKRTGKLLWSDNSPGKNIMRGQWASPAYAAEPVPQVIFPGGDGWLRAFDPKTGALLWKFDGNPKAAGADDRNDFLAAPVIHNGRVYIGTGQDHHNDAGVGHLWCIDLKRAVENGAKNKDRDVSPVNDNFDPAAEVNKNSALAWHHGGHETRPFATQPHRFGRTTGAVAIVNDVVYAGELNGYVHCLDAKTGKLYWRLDAKASIWGGVCAADDRVFVGTDDSDLLVLRHAKTPEVIDELDIQAKDAKEARPKIREKRQQVANKYLTARVEFDGLIRVTPTASGGVLYVATETTLYAIGKR